VTSVHVPALTGARFVAAASVLLGHFFFAVSFSDATFNKSMSVIALPGMSLFFVLSGFVLYLNYSHFFVPGNMLSGLREFAVARFARLFPLYFLFMLVIIAISDKAMLAAQWPSFEAGSELRGQFSSMIIAGYTWLTAYEFWRGRSEPLVSRWPAILLFSTLGAMFLLRSPLNALLHGKDADHILASAWLSVLSLEAFLMTIATAFILLAMSKERTELRHKTAAMTDPLTGLLNRRAFLQDAEALLQQQIARDRPIGVLLIDLDHFKSINDRFGHTVGDKVLQIFAKTSQANLRQTDLVGRLGGEEFTVVLADAGIDNAYLVADRLRNAFAVAAAVVDGEALHATASIGVAVIVDPVQDLARLITLADQALYLAKARGRNRVEVAPLGIAMGEAPAPRMLVPQPEQNAA